MNIMEKNVIIWGTGKGGQIAYDLLSQDEHLRIIAFGDNDKKKQGGVFNGLPVFGKKSIPSKFDYIVVAAPNYENEIYEQLSGITDKPIYKSVELLNKRFSIDISGWCNARCKWCSTGRKNLMNSCVQEYMSIDSFRKIYLHLRDVELLHPFNEMLLYSWGEPFLNPDIKEILHFLHENKQKFSISTNASAPQYVVNEELDYEYCNIIVFSMCGFSQASYDRIHKFNFERIKTNISLMITNAREHGFKGNAHISYHVYQFNQHELQSAKEFAESLGIDIVPQRAYFADYKLTKEYLSEQLPEDISTEAKNELFLSHVRNLIEERPEGYKCPLENMVSIHWDGSIELCCCCDDSAEDFLWKNILEVGSLSDWQKYRKSMMMSNTCNECRKMGIDYWVFNNPKYEEVF